MTNRTVLITGCSSGFGKLAVNTFRAGGWNVVATMRSPEKEAELTGLEGVLVTRLDVKDPQSIDAAFEQGAAAFGSIDAVVNNAGYGSNALFEQSPDASVRDIYETNVFGLMNVMRRALPDMRERGSGRIVNVDVDGGPDGPARQLGVLVVQVRGRGTHRSTRARVQAARSPHRFRGARGLPDDRVRRQHGQLHRVRRPPARRALAECPRPLRLDRLRRHTAGSAGGSGQDLPSA